MGNEVAKKGEWKVGDKGTKKGEWKGGGEKCRPTSNRHSARHAIPLHVRTVFGGAFPGQGGGGCWAEKVVIEPGAYRLYHLPTFLNMRQACNILSNYSTAWAGLVIIGGIKKGQIVLCHAGAGGVSLSAIHIAKHMFGCTVIATCGSEAKRQVCLREGADHAIDYTVTKNWPDEVKKITQKLGRKGPRIGVDLVYDPIAAVNDSLKACAWGAKIVVIGFASRDAATDPERVPTNRVLIKQCSVLGCRAGESWLKRCAVDFQSSDVILPPCSSKQTHEWTPRCNHRNGRESFPSSKQPRRAP